MERKSDNSFTFEDWEALYNVLSTLELITLAEETPWEDIVKDGFIALAKLEIPKVPNPFETINTDSLINTTEFHVPSQSLTNSVLNAHGNNTITEIKVP